MNNNTRWIPIDCTTPAVAGIIIGLGCGALADILPMFHVNWYASKAMWLSPILGVITTAWLYKEGLRDLPPSWLQPKQKPVTPDEKKGVDRHA